MADDENKLSRRKGFLPQTDKIHLPLALASRIELFPENKRRPVNKTVFKNEYFQLTYNTRDHSLSISTKGDLVYSAIPYDTARNYIQRAGIQYLIRPEGVRQYIELHQSTIENYLVKSIFQVSGQKVSENSFDVKQAYNAILQNPLLEIQVTGRLMQHDETGPLSANLAGKFLFSENLKTGISGYLSEYLNFVIQATNALPLMIDGGNVRLLDSTEPDPLLLENNLSIHSNIETALALLPQEVKQGIENALQLTNQPLINTQPLLRSEYGKELTHLRENYIAHSVHPDELAQSFENVHSAENRNLINVLSDIHATEGQLPFVNRNFNILAGDVSDSKVENQEIAGIYVIGMHELLDVLPESADTTTNDWKKWQSFFHYEWFKALTTDPEEASYLLPIGDAPFYEVVKGELTQRFAKMHVLNNEGLIHEGVRYIGLTIPVSLVQRKAAVQRFLLKILKELLGEDREIPTVIVSHTPLFNELSLLSPTSEAYNKENVCQEPGIEELFAEYNILGVIHGHHHIPASSRRFAKVVFGGKTLFVVCSIYSKVNTGFELMNLLNSEK